MGGAGDAASAWLGFESKAFGRGEGALRKAGLKGGEKEEEESRFIQGVLRVLSRELRPAVPSPGPCLCPILNV